MINTLLKRAEGPEDAVKGHHLDKSATSIKYSEFFRLGVFCPESILPLALEVNHVQQNSCELRVHIVWEDYVLDPAVGRIIYPFVDNRGCFFRIFWTDRLDFGVESIPGQTIELGY